MLYNRCTGIYKFGNNTYPRRIRRRSNLGLIFGGKKCVLWAGNTVIYFSSKPLHVSSRFAAHHQEDQLCMNSSCYSHVLCWLTAGRIGVEQFQQACSKHVEAYYWNKLVENSAFSWFILYAYITLHGQENIKFVFAINCYCNMFRSQFLAFFRELTNL